MPIIRGLAPFILPRVDAPICLLRQYACCAKSRLRLPGWRMAAGVIRSR